MQHDRKVRRGKSGPARLDPENRRSEYVKVPLTPPERRFVEETCARLGKEYAEAFREAFARFYGSHAA